MNELHDSLLQKKDVAGIICFLCLWYMAAVLSAGEGRAEEPVRTGQRTCFDKHGKIIDHAGTGQDGELQRGRVWPDLRFIDNGDGTVSDLLTGLMWLADANCPGRMSWQAAAGMAGKSDCSKGSSYTDWTLPDIRQLETLFNGEEVSLPVWLESWGILNVQPAPYWSLTKSPNPYTAWCFDFSSGIARQAALVEQAFVILVRPQNSAAGPGRPDPVDKRVRFVNNGDGTVTDNETALMWMRDSGCLGARKWSDAFAAIRDCREGNQESACCAAFRLYGDWSLPNSNEMRSLVDHDRDLPALTAGHPFLNLEKYYWTSTSAADRPDQALKMYLGSGALERGAKEEKHHLWLVRSAADTPLRERIKGKTREQIYKKVNYMFHATGKNSPVDWPAVGFADQGDGTVIDNRSGLMWLKDASCLGKKKWKDSFDAIERLNLYPHRVGCKEYVGAYADWRLPTLRELSVFPVDTGIELAEWLTDNGVIAVAARDYWTASEHYLNIYYAWAENLKNGYAHNYSKSFELYVWPVREVTNRSWSNPKAVIMVNGARDQAEVVQGEPVDISVSVSGVSNIVPAEFRLWYEAPDMSVWWLNPAGKWMETDTVLYRGIVFPMDAYRTFIGRTTGMAPGEYALHFDIRMIEEKDEPVSLFPTTFSSVLSLAVKSNISNREHLLWQDGPALEGKYGHVLSRR